MEYVKDWHHVQEPNASQRLMQLHVFLRLCLIILGQSDALHCHPADFIVATMLCQKDSAAASCPSSQTKSKPVSRGKSWPRALRDGTGDHRFADNAERSSTSSHLAEALGVASACAAACCCIWQPPILLTEPQQALFGIVWQCLGGWLLALATRAQQSQADHFIKLR